MSKELILLLVFVAATLLGMLIATALAVGFGSKLLGILGIACATVNVVAGFSVTDRMLRMFKGHGHEPEDRA